MKIIAYFDFDGEIAHKRLVQDDSGYRIEQARFHEVGVGWEPLTPGIFIRPYAVLDKLMAEISAAARPYDERKNGRQAFRLPDTKEVFPVSERRE